MDANEGVAWARRVVARGWPRKETPIAERVEVYEDLAAAYGVLADEAHQHGDTDNYLALSELVEHADRFVRELRGPETRW